MVIRESPFTARFDERVLSELRKWNVPGLGVAIVQGSSIFTKVGPLQYISSVLFSLVTYTGLWNLQIP